MIDRVRLKRPLLLAAVLFFIASGTAFLAGAPAFSGGLALGFVLGALPFASWAWIAARGLKSARARLLAVLLLITKLGIYSGALYLFVTRHLVNPAGVMVGITGVVATVSIGSFLPAAPAKEAA